MNATKFWPFGALIVLAVALVAAILAAMLFKYERSAKASALPNAARIARVDGQVGINQSSDNTANAQWIQATNNMPVGVGDRIYTKANSQTEIEFTGRNVATIDPNSSLDVLDLSEDRTQVALREGSALFDVGSISSGSLFEIATPCGAVDLQQPGLYQVAISPDGNATATAFSGAAQVVGQYGSGQIQKGESLAVSCQGNSPAVMSRVEPNRAGTYIDNYYRVRYPKRYDGRYRSYYTYLEDPYYYEPTRLYSSYNYVSDYIPGIDDLDDYGQWQYVSDYGYCWHPNEYVGWAPYREGYWTMDYPYGLTWVSSEPWGYAPYHYGRWAYASNEWYWVPERVNAYPAYSPALVAFLPIGDSNVAWVALGPSDPYVNRYYDSDWQPVYFDRSNVVVDRVANLGAPNAVVVVPAQDFVRPIDPTIITRVDSRTFNSVRPVLDPLTVNSLRQVALQTREASRRIDVPREVDQRMGRAPVVATSAPIAPPFKRDLARSFNVEPLSARVRNQKLQISDHRNATAQQAAPQINIAADQARERQMADLARQAARGNESARQQMRQFRQQQPQPLAGVRASAQAQAQPQGERVGQPIQQQQRAMIRQQQQAQREAARQQMITTQQQRRAAQEQMRVQRPQTQPQPRAIRNTPQPQVLRPRQQRRGPQPRYQRSAQPRVMAPPARPRVERRVAAPMRVPQPPARPQVIQPRPQAQPRPQTVQPRPQPVQPRPQAQPRATKPPEQKGGGRKKPGGR